MRVTLRFVAAARLLAALLAGAVLPASASHAAPAPGPGATAVHARRFEAGLLIGIDHETGQLGMVTPEQMARLTAVPHARALSTSPLTLPIHLYVCRVSLYVCHQVCDLSVRRLRDH